ncbi:MAG: Tol-Pal system beta propeller repeat protein TolB [Deltaproteobacteria bacterium]|nr:Tol-Pal system beta propeller repeat protein TolB [Deltaproteobacteria bacterium]
MKKICFYFLLLVLGPWSTVPGPLLARIYIPIDQPSDKKLPMAITRLVNNGGAGREAETIPAIIQNDLEISSYFQFIPPEAFLESEDSNAVTAEAINFDLWTAIEAQALIKGSVEKAKGRVTVELRLFDPFLKQLLVGKQYRGSEKDLRAMAHRFSDEVMLALTGILGPFNSKITYTAPSKRGNKTIHVMDYDGFNDFQITHPKTISLGSKFSPDGSRVAFTSYASGTPEIYIAELGGRVKQITANGATNITPAFSPDGGTIIFSSSVKGDPDIWIMNTAGRMIAQLTNVYGVDISPLFSPDGSRILFSSERVGNLHVQTMDPSGGNITRLTFVGKFNDTPAFSPDGTKIAFCGRDMEGFFDIFVMNADGSYIQRLTRGDGDNTHPSWSADGRFITFASSRAGEAVYIMRFDGENPAQVSKGFGSLPWWGPRLP